MITRLLDRLRNVPRTEDAWRVFNRFVAATLFGCLSLLFAAVYLVDPWGVIPFSLPIDRPIVDIMQRHLYPMVIRTGRYDSLVIGNSTIRLLDPADLEETLGGRFANLAMNDGRAFEQWRIADLYLRENGPPQILVVGLDGTWCHPEADAPENRITKRGFPEWIYDDNPWNNLPHVLNSRTVEFAVRVIATKLGLREKRLADNGYGVFVPPESDYDLDRARQHIWGDGERQIPVTDPPVRLSDKESGELEFPALQWLDDLMRRSAGKTRFVMVWLPVHIRTQPAPGTRAAAVEDICKKRIDALARPHDSLVIDWRIPSATTRTDSNYWDSLHYRLPIARQIAESIRAAENGETAAPDGSWKVRVSRSTASGS